MILIRILFISCLKDLIDNALCVATPAKIKTWKFYWMDHCFDKEHIIYRTFSVTRKVGEVPLMMLFFVRNVMFVCFFFCQEDQNKVREMEKGENKKKKETIKLSEVHLSYIIVIIWMVLGISLCNVNTIITHLTTSVT